MNDIKQRLRQITDKNPHYEHEGINLYGLAVDALAEIERLETAHADLVAHWTQAFARAPLIAEEPTRPAGSVSMRRRSRGED